MFDKKNWRQIVKGNEIVDKKHTFQASVFKCFLTSCTKFYNIFFQFILWIWIFMSKNKTYAWSISQGSVLFVQGLTFQKDFEVIFEPLDIHRSSFPFFDGLTSFIISTLKIKENWIFGPKYLTSLNFRAKISNFFWNISLSKGIR